MKPYANDGPSGRRNLTHIVSRYGLTKVLSCLLLDTGKAEINSKDRNGQTPLLWAARSGQEAVVKMLFDTGEVNIDSKNRNGRKPLWWAAENGQEAVVKMLRQGRR